MKLITILALLMGALAASASATEDRSIIPPTRMGDSKRRSLWLGWVVRIVAGLGLLTLLVGGTGTAQKPAADANAQFATDVQPPIKKYCLSCHSTKVMKGSLDLERFASLDQVRNDLKPWH